MSTVLIFSDASADPGLETGFGAYLTITEAELDSIDLESRDATDALNGKLKVKQFAATAPAQLEIATALWALQDVMTRADSPAGNITLYTDSQSIINLPRRRSRLEQSGFRAASGKALNHAALYRAFYQLDDRLGFKLVKLVGHSKRTGKTQLDRVFSLVDQAARRALREYRATVETPGSNP